MVYWRSLHQYWDSSDTYLIDPKMKRSKSQTQRYMNTGLKGPAKRTFNSVFDLKTRMPGNILQKIDFDCVWHPSTKAEILTK